MSIAYEERSKAMEQLITHAERDDAFREQLKSDPRAAIAQEFGVTPPEDLQVRVIEEAPNEVVLVLPAKVEPGAISDEALSGAAGGSGDYCGTWSAGGYNCTPSCGIPGSGAGC